MITLKLNGQIVDLFPNASISLRWTNPMFSETADLGGYSFPMELPPTARNSAALGAPERIDAAGDSINTTHTYELYVQGSLFMAGSAKLIKPITRRSYRIYLLTTAFGDAVKGKTTADFTWGGVRDLGDQTYQGWLDHFVDTIDGKVADWCFFTSAFVPKETYDFTGSNAETLVNYLNYSAVPAQTRYYSPYPRVAYVLRQIFAELGYELQSEWLKGDEIKDLVFWSPVRKTWDADPGGSLSDPYANEINLKNFLPAVSAAEIIEAVRKAFCATVFFDRRNQKATIKTNREVILSAKVKDWTGKNDPAYELAQDEAVSGYTLGWTKSDNGMRTAYLQKMLNLLLRESENWIEEYYAAPNDVAPLFHYLWTQPGVDYVNYQEVGFNPGDIIMPTDGLAFWYFIINGTPLPTPDPDKGWRLDELGKWFISREGFDQSYGGVLPANACEWHEALAEYVESVATLGDLPALVPSGSYDQFGKVYWVEEESLYYVGFMADPVSPFITGARWLPLCGPAMDDIILGSGSKVLRAPADTLNMALVYDSVEDMQIRVPIAQMDMLDEIEGTPQSFPLYFMFWRGRIAQYVGDNNPTPPAHTYPYGSSDCLTYTNEANVGELTLNWSEDHGLYAQFWQEWLSFAGNPKKLTSVIRLTLNDLLNFSFSDKIRLDNQNYLVAQMDITITQRGISPTKCELRKL